MSIVGVIYRPPGQDVKEFNDFTNVLLSKIMHNDKPVYIMGDFKGVLHPWALFLKTLCIFSKNKAI